MGPSSDVDSTLPGHRGPGTEAEPDVTRVLVVDDHAFFRERVSEILSAAFDIEVVGRGEDGIHLVELAARTAPDVVVMDGRMPIMSGTEATRLLMVTQPDVRVLILTASLSPLLVDEARAAGAVGVLEKGVSAGELVEAVRWVGSGGTVWPPAGPRTPASG